MVADNDMVAKMMERLEKLLNCVSIQRALSLSSIERDEILTWVELRVVRECNLPDNYTNVLRVTFYSPDFLIRSVEISLGSGWLYQKTKGTL